MDVETNAPPIVRTGVPGLDDVLAGGLTQGNLFLLEGSPGTGKTTIALRFLLEGAKVGDQGLYITLSETEQELREGAASHGWQLGDRVAVFEVVPPESLLDADQQQSLLYSSDLELGETTRLIFSAFERVRPSRVVLDSLSEIRLLAQSSLRYRRQVLAIKHYFSRQGATVLLLDDLTADAADKTVHSVAHGVIKLEELAPDYGAERRRLRISKYRGQAFRGGYHDFSIKRGGVSVFPRLVAAEHRTRFTRAQTRSDVPELDALLGGGIEQGSSTLVLGPAGTGKSIFVLQFIAAAVARGEKAALFAFDEELGLLFDRTRALGFDLEAMRDAGKLYVEQVDAAELSPGEFAQRVRNCVDHAQAKTVAIDSLNGYQAAMPQENALVLHIHELLQYLNRQGATTFLTVAQHGLVGDMKAPVDVTYLADTVILLRYFEALGSVRRAVSIIKKRTGYHEETIREFRIGRSGLSVGAPLDSFQGILRGVPTFVGNKGPLMSTGAADDESA
ncbi:ATPase domain-containing protein [Paraburkholderia unamae]|uniref:non-specific serine/threonine protein kinase n=2 Tax=Paraburkholderia unamae TaxID=219649 RepID=A0ABX5K741_9BURK|nr:ATPase domain-containing protein [Paraburkholderia unamae]PVX61354.1 circadian clock protein KaiC [Paraburkholderia unamae]RAR49282.1 circadian clock protein KaiC [Paraburkholderia unamae]